MPIIAEDGRVIIKLTSNIIITADMTFTTEEFIYGTDALTLSNVPRYVLQPIFSDASPMFEDSDYTRNIGDFTIINPLMPFGSIIRITYAY